MTSATPSDSNHRIVVNQLPPDQDFDARFGYEPEGSSCCGESYSEDDGSKQATYTKWSNNLTSLLNSNGGLKAFQKFLEKTNPNHYQMLIFLSACKGAAEAKKLNDKEVPLKIIFQKFILTNLFEMDESKRDAVMSHFEENKRGKPLCPDIFKDICRDIEDTMKKEMYPNFLAYQAEKIQNKSKSCCRGEHDCKKHFFQQHRSTCQTKPADRTLHFDLDNAKPPEPGEFYKVLMQKLEKVKNEEEDKTKEYRSQPDEIPPLRDVLARVISDKIEDSNYEDILDQHIAKVLPDNEHQASSNYGLHKYSDSKKFTLAKNPAALKDPRVIPHPYDGIGPARRRSKDVYSFDSGFGTGYYSDDTRKDCEYETSVRSQPRKLNETWASRQTLADSGTGMVSEDEYAQYTEKMCEKRDKYRSSHISEANKYRLSHPSEAEKYRSYHVAEGDARYKYTFNMMNYRDRHTHYINDIPSVSMNSLHSNDSYAQVEEERTHRLRNEMKQKLKSPAWSGNICQNQGNASSFPKHSSKMENMQPRIDEHVYTTVVYNFNDEKLPYRVKVPGNRITLKLFKEYMPKKGNYRYFFITPCEDLGAVQEEITDEHRVLPLWEGKIDARIKAIK